MQKISEVISYSGYKANERPLSFTMDHRKFEVRNIICHWVDPDKDIFKIIANDGNIYNLSWNRKPDLWTVEEVHKGQQGA